MHSVAVRDPDHSPIKAPVAWGRSPLRQYYVVNIRDIFNLDSFAMLTLRGTKMFTDKKV